MLKYLAAAIVLIGAGSAHASVVTLVDGKGVTTGGPPRGSSEEPDSGWYDTYLEMDQAGFRYDQGGGTLGELIFLSDDNGYNTSSYVFRPDGKRFSLLKADARAGGKYEKTSNSPPPAPSDYENVGTFYDDYVEWLFGGDLGVPPIPETSLRWEGYRQGTIVASWVSPNVGRDVSFGEAFTNLDKVVLTATASASSYYLGYIWYPSPGPNLFSGLGPNTAWCEEFCFDSRVYSLTLDVIDSGPPEPAPVPLPAGLPLLATGFGMLAAARARRRG